MIYSLTTVTAWARVIIIDNKDIESIDYYINMDKNC